MSTELTTFNPSSAVANFDEAFDDFDRDRPTSGGGTPFMRMTDKGVWVFGRNLTQVESGSRWAIDLATLNKGFVAWQGGTPTEQIAYIGQPPVTLADLPPTDAKKGWEPQVGFGLICQDGEDAGEMAIYKTNSAGGIEAWNEIFDAVKARRAARKTFIPVVVLESDNYIHPEHGKVYKPIISIVEWLAEQDVAAPSASESDDDGGASTEPAPSSVDEDEPPRRQRRQRRE